VLTHEEQVIPTTLKSTCLVFTWLVSILIPMVCRLLLLFTQLIAPDEGLPVLQDFGL
jgi:hypothetical protein